MSSEEFYIGWQEEMPPSNKRFIKRMLIGLFILIPLFLMYGILFQKPFNHHHFEFGTITELTGVYYDNPFPILIVEDEVPGGFSKEVLLVGFGKFGAERIISGIEGSQGSLNGKEVTFRGTLIFGDGVTLLELTSNEESFVKAVDTNKQYLGPETKPMDVTLVGEILDPKCYFGVMKPGEGKIHKSCAIRCLSGGIPPVMRVLKEDGISYDYYLVKGKNGEAVNKKILPYVAETITVSGMGSFQNGWMVLEIDLESIERNK
ncbi:MAG: hypothetical protein ACMZ7B_08500 [Balneola sp.]